MTDKSLQDKAIDIKGKAYVLVADRIRFFNDNYAEGSIATELVSKPEDDMVVIKATVTPVAGQNRAFTAYSQATWDDGYINKSSALENCETSAVGRALGFMGIGVIDSIASVDEINKAQIQPPKKTAETKLTPEIARAKARTAIENANNIWNLAEVEKNIKKSTNLTEKDKEELLFMVNERREMFDPTVD